MSGLTPEIVTIEIGAESFTLTPCTGALMGISQTLEGPFAAIKRLQGMDMLAVTHVIAAGAGLNDAAVKKLPDMIYESGQLDEICAGAVRFCLLLMNGGKSRSAADPSERPEGGNAKKAVH